MSSASRLAVTLDEEMLLIHGVDIATSTTPDGKLPSKSGIQVAKELGGRYLLRYLLPEQIGAYSGGSTKLHYVTPTPICPNDTVPYLALPAVARPRRHVILLDATKVPEILGPRWIRAGNGIEYLLPRGYPSSALVVGWEVEVV